ncbi:MAG TPA: zf-HC2 domain-containing protein [Thermoanaerobaculia bacterium]|jgi:hypothetical protein|nr:zf-HC2 domain-containing protein [Thermoanaerobaculia bacterium]
MTTNDELVRLRTAFAAPAVSGTSAPEPEACPPSDTIWLAVRGELPPDDLREILDHIAACPACAEDWRIAMEFEGESRAVVPVPVPPRPADWISKYRAWAVAATILLAVVGFQIRNRTPQPPPGYRSGQEQMIETTLPENAPLSRRSFTLTWRGIPEAASYNLTLTVVTDDMKPIHDATGLTSTTYTVPESAFAGVASGTKILWNVTPVSRDGALLEGHTFVAFLDHAAGQ